MDARNRQRRNVQPPSRPAADTQYVDMTGLTSMVRLHVVLRSFNLLVKHRGAQGGFDDESC
jgi:hypothetical protein